MRGFFLPARAATINVCPRPWLVRPGIGPGACPRLRSPGPGVPHRQSRRVQNAAALRSAAGSPARARRLRGSSDRAQPRRRHLRQPSLWRSRNACVSRQPEPCVVRHRGHHAAVAVRARGGHAVAMGRSDHLRRNARSVRRRADPAGDIVGIGIHTGNALRGYEVGRAARERGRLRRLRRHPCHAVSDEPHELGGAHAVVRGDGDDMWGTVIDDCAAGQPKRVYEAGRVARQALQGRRAGTCCRTTATCGRRFRPCAAARSTARSARCGAPTDRSRGNRASIGGHRRGRGAAPRGLPLHRAGRRQLLSGLARRSRAGRAAQRRHAGCSELEAIRAERFALMERLAQLPNDMVFYTQITMEAAEDPPFLEAMARRGSSGALVGVESVTAEGLKDVYKGFNLVGDALVERLQTFKRARHPRARVVHLRSAERSAGHVRRDRRARRARRRDLRPVRHAHAVSGHGRLREVGDAIRPAKASTIAGVPITRHWLIPQAQPAQGVLAAPGDVCRRDPAAARRRAWDRFYCAATHLGAGAGASARARARLAFVLISKLYRRMYANTGIATDSARHGTVGRSVARARPVPPDLFRHADAGPAGASRLRGGRPRSSRKPEPRASTATSRCAALGSAAAAASGGGARWARQPFQPSNMRRPCRTGGPLIVATAPRSGRYAWLSIAAAIATMGPQGGGLRADRLGRPALRRDGVVRQPRRGRSWPS